MEKLLIHTVDQPEVRAENRPLTPEEITSPQMQEFYPALIEAMIRYEGVGIAAPQVGQNIQVVVITKDHAPADDHQVLINPRIVSYSNSTNVMEEGCLSVPGKFGPIERSKKVRVKAFLPNGEPIDIKAKGFYARILQHEVDHLNQTVYIDNALEVYERDSDEIHALSIDE